MDLNLNQVTDLETRLRAEYEEKLRAVEMVKQMLQQTSPAQGASKAPPKKGASGPISAPTAEATVSLIGSIEALLQERDVAWSIPGIISELSGRPGFRFAAQRPESSVNVAVNRLIVRNAVRLVVKGSGRIPNLYKAAKWVSVAA